MLSQSPISVIPDALEGIGLHDYPSPTPAHLRRTDAPTSSSPARLINLPRIRDFFTSSEVRHTRVLVEGVHDNVRLLAEAAISTGERIDSLRKETTGSLERIEGAVGMIHKVLVPRVESLEGRVKILEGEAERKNRDVLEVLRERFGPRQAS